MKYYLTVFAVLISVLFTSSKSFASDTFCDEAITTKNHAPFPIIVKFGINRVLNPFTVQLTKPGESFDTYTWGWPISVKHILTLDLTVDSPGLLSTGHYKVPLKAGQNITINYLGARGITYEENSFVCK